MISSLELARICGVSQGTVDRALHNRKGISDATRGKILETASKYGYCPHPAAREIITGKNMTVSAILPAINSVFIMDLMGEIKKKLVEKGYRLIFTTFENTNEMLELLADFSARRNCASIIMPQEENLTIPEHLSTDMKIISLFNPAKGKNVFFLSPDEKKTGHDAVDYLFKTGHRKIIHLTYPRENFYAVRMRMNGYFAEMKKKNLNGITVAGLTEKKLLDMIKKEKPDALFCHNDWLALSAIRILEKNKIPVPEDISVLGIDNSPTFIELCPDITTMEYPHSWIASSLAALIYSEKKVPQAPSFRIIERKTVNSKIWSKSEKN